MKDMGPTVVSEESVSLEPRLKRLLHDLAFGIPLDGLEFSL